MRPTKRTFVHHARLVIVLLATGQLVSSCGPFIVSRLTYAPTSQTVGLNLPANKRPAIFVATVTDHRGVDGKFLNVQWVGRPYVLPVPLAVEVRRFLVSELRQLGVPLVSPASEAAGRLETKVTRLEFTGSVLYALTATYSMTVKLYPPGAKLPVWEASLKGSGQVGLIIEAARMVAEAASQALSNAIGKLGRAPGFVEALARLPTSPTAVAKKEGPHFPVTPVAVKFLKAATRPDDIAVIIGNANYKKLGKDIPNVKPAYADAEGMKRYAMEALGVSEDNIIFIKDATQGNFSRIFGSETNPKGQLFDWVEPGKSRVFVYYSGHGAPGDREGNSYLVPADANASRIELNGYPLRTLYRNLGKLPAKSVTVVIEACFSGVSQSGSVISSASPVYLKSKAPFVPPNVTVISAGGSNQIASWEKGGSHSLFTKYFLKGMSGEADKNPYGNGDGKVGYSELKRYLKRTVTRLARRYYGRDQVAEIVNARGR